MNKGDQRSNPHSRVDSQGSIDGVTVLMEMGIDSTLTLSRMEGSSAPSRSHVERERNELSASQLSPFSHDGVDSGNHSISSSSDSDLERCTLEEVEEEVRQEVVQLRQLPYRDYQCHRCGRKDHMIKYCGVKLSEGTTPYQGKSVSEGWFDCKVCNRGWHSWTSFSNVAQRCQKCMGMVFPHKQRPIKKEGTEVDQTLFFDLTKFAVTPSTQWYSCNRFSTVSNFNTRSVQHQQMDSHEIFNFYS